MLSKIAQILASKRDADKENDLKAGALLPFENSRYCVKCAAFDRAWRKHCSSCDTEPAQEHLHCECLNCGYTWLESCADGPSEKEEENGLRDHSTCGGDIDVASATPAASRLWTLFKCPHCGKKSAEEIAIPDAVKMDPDILIIDYKEQANETKKAN